ncbi:glutaredoxin family protein [Caldimonas tepidiphila]|uniref:glutaredoxin family protein n=1 Tax=Caldimonas tepidiphila TaxID=2315841 RepID=UPI000E5AF7B3|nr:glutaredoxin family protein [Caldimonas tepidiphila]
MNAPQDPRPQDSPPPAADAPKPLRTLLLMGALIAAMSGGVLLIQGRGEQKLSAELQARAQPGDIRMISSQTCVYCNRAREWLTEHRVPFDECFIERDARCAAQYQALGARGTPTLLVRGQPVLGFNPERIAAVLAATSR